MKNSKVAAPAVFTLAIGATAACGSSGDSGGSDASSAQAAHGPVKVLADAKIGVARLDHTAPSASL